MKQIDLSQFVQTGEGANGLSYDSLNDANLMAKMYNREYDVNAIIQELDVARKVYEAGIPSPEPGELVTDGERVGILFRRIVGKRSFARAISQEPERLDEFTSEFAAYCRQLHSKEDVDGIFPDTKGQFLHMLDKSSLFQGEDRRVFREFIVERVPDTKNLLHGDMHIGNMLTTLGKDEPFSLPHDVYFIDLGFFSHGCPLIDIGMLYNICLLSDDDFLFSNMHIRRPQAISVWRTFAREYFFSEDKLGERYFGKGVTQTKIDEMMEPYAMMKLLLVEYNCGAMPPVYLDFCRRCVADIAVGRY